MSTSANSQASTRAGEIPAGQIPNTAPFLGASLAKILCTGQWKSTAFLQYVVLDEFERNTVVMAHLDESSSDDIDPDAVRTQ